VEYRNRRKFGMVRRFQTNVLDFLWVNNVKVIVSRFSIFGVFLNTDLSFRKKKVLGNGLSKVLGK